MHLNAGKSFDHLWTVLLSKDKRLGSNVQKEIKIKTNEGRINFRNYADLTDIVRLLMGIYLMDDERNSEDFEKYL